MSASPITIPMALFGCLAVTSMLAPQVRAAQESDLVAHGANIARDLCAQCHALDDGAKQSSSGPAFPEVARMPSTTSASIKVFLKTPHANMPNIILTEQDIDALALYILSMRAR